MQTGEISAENTYINDTYASHGVASSGWHLFRGLLRHADVCRHGVVNRDHFCYFRATGLNVL
jgi:hypothetical protein